MPAEEKRGYNEQAQVYADTFTTATKSWKAVSKTLENVIVNVSKSYNVYIIYYSYICTYEPVL